ncbi:SDR family NAD(P)-dependent oxidoreductase [Gryllotalpicola reticulitermitis]|uniref:SDR family NAD(P)-dependent oxidoreductase n=1 Tax=Gryllotalpicola reticulitermitis TaxID=1184153 RepID=A0ABV8Q455_9MICO
MAHVLEGKVALVTGANSGIGLAIAQKFVDEGAHVYITGRRLPELEAAAAQLGSNATAVRTDASDLGSLDGLFDTIARQSGRLDVLVANAGSGSTAPLGAITEEQYDNTFDVNVKGTLFTVQKALPLLVDGAAVVLTGSTTSITGSPAFSVYAASKAAIRSLARGWIIDLKGRNIRVNVLAPGPTETPGLVGLAAPEHRQALLDNFAAEIPLGRVGKPEEIANAALFLASDQSSFVNGIELFVDGGVAQV